MFILQSLHGKNDSMSSSLIENTFVNSITVLMKQVCYALILVKYHLFYQYCY